MFARADDQHEPFIAGWSARQLLAALMIALLAFAGSDILLRANGVYGERERVTVQVVEKRIDRGRRNSVRPKLFVQHRGERPYALVDMAQYDAVRVGDRIATVIIPGRLYGRHVFLDAPGLKLDPQTRIVAFGLIVGSHLLAVLAVFVWLVRRAERA